MKMHPEIKWSEVARQSIIQKTLLLKKSMPAKDFFKLLPQETQKNIKEGTITVLSVIEHPPCWRKSFDIIYPEMIDYIKAVYIADKLNANGTPIGAMDVLIAAMCLNRSARLITKDKGFQFVKNVAPDFEVKILNREHAQ